MAQKNTEAKRITPAKLAQTDRALTAISQLRNYKPQRTEYSLDHAKEMQARLQAAQEAEQAAETAYNNARDAATQAE